MIDCSCAADFLLFDKFLVVGEVFILLLTLVVVAAARDGDSDGKPDMGDRLDALAFPILAVAWLGATFAMGWGVRGPDPRVFKAPLGRPEKNDWIIQTDTVAGTVAEIATTSADISETLRESVDTS
jgi:hypothetical protein